MAETCSEVDAELSSEAEVETDEAEEETASDEAVATCEEVDSDFSVALEVVTAVENEEETEGQLP